MIRLGLAAAFIVTTALMPGHAAAEPITIADVGPSAVHWAGYVAVAEGYFSEGGIEADYVKTQSSAAALLQLAAGSVAMASAGVPDTLRAIEKGAPITLLRIEQGPAPYQVYAKPNIRAFADLKGKLVSLGGNRDITRVYFERMAAANGLAPGSYDMVFAGSTAARMAAPLCPGRLTQRSSRPPSASRRRPRNTPTWLPSLIMQREFLSSALW